jgi:hypothetical protein
LPTSKEEELTVYRSEITNTVTGALERMVEDWDALDFPQLRHDFSDTKIYWRKTSTTAETTKP